MSLPVIVQLFPIVVSLDVWNFSSDDKSLEEKQIRVWNFAGIFESSNRGYPSLPKLKSFARLSYTFVSHFSLIRDTLIQVCLIFNYLYLMDASVLVQIVHATMQTLRFVFVSRAYGVILLARFRNKIQSKRDTPPFVFFRNDPRDSYR